MPYYRPEYDIIINPFDERTHCWDFQKEVIEKEDLEAIAHSLFGGKSKDLQRSVNYLLIGLRIYLFVASDI